MKHFQWVVAIALLACQCQQGSAQPEKGKKGPLFELGKVLPPFVRGQLDLTDEQKKQIQELEQEVRARLLKILTAEQKTLIEELREKGPKGPPGKDKEGGKKGPAKTGELSSSTGGIQWYATWQSAVREAERTGKPIFLVSATPHCAGISGTW